jgi:polysaccharide biosynthesis/export protein
MTIPVVIAKNRGWGFLPILAAFVALLSPVCALAQDTPRTPAQGDTQCANRDCPPDTALPADDDNANEPVTTDPNTRDSGAAADQQNGNSPGQPLPIEKLGEPGFATIPDKPEKRMREKRDLEADKVPEPPPTEFQEFIAASVGRKLPLYGHNLFERVPTTFAPVDRIPVTGGYVLGPEDEILLRVWGQIDFNARLVVDRGGEVFLPKVGALAVSGLRYEQLSDFFRAAIGRVFRNFDLTVSLGRLRSIEIFVVGQARRPGTYTVSSLSTLVNALFASGGPANSGSLRRIQLRRENRLVEEFDFYDLLLKGDKSRDAKLLPGDVIYIPPAGPSIAVAGSVNVPGIYELNGDTTLAGAVEMAGGLTSVADGGKAVVERIEHHDSRWIEEFPLDAAGMQRTLQDGDLVRILPLSRRFENAVTLRGNVARPGRVPWHEGMRLRDIIPDQAALVPEGHWRSSNAAANPKPRTRTDPAGEGKQERRDNAAEETEPRSPIAPDVPEINWDYAVIQRMNPEDLTTRLIPFDLGKLMLEGDERANLALEPGDIVTIFSQNDLAVPMARRSKLIRLEGEFASAGVYRAEPGETLPHLIERAGGFTTNAYLYGAEFTRESARRQQQKGLDRLIQELEEDVTRGALGSSNLNPEDAGEQQARLEAQREMIARLRDVKASGRVVLDLQPDSNQSSALPAIELEDGDRFVVPSRPSTVEVLGAVYNRNSFVCRHGARVDDYLKLAGGATRDGDASRMFLLRADGSVLSRQSARGLWNGGFGMLRLMPGDAIVVPERLSRGTFLRGLRDWSQVFSQFALGAAAVRVIQ